MKTTRQNENKTTQDAIAFERHLDRVLNNQEPAVPFARILGRSLCCRSKGQIVDHVDTFFDAFGPPEILRTRRTKLLYWNFQREDGKLGFSLLVPFAVNKNPEGSIEVDVAAKRQRDLLPFMQWALDQIGISSNGEQAPRFLDASRFVVVPA